MPEAVIVIGAGIAGLHVARRLRRDHKQNPLVIEASPRVGGRIHTVYDEHNQLKYEGGPWRIPTNHLRMMRLCRELEIPLRPAKTPVVEISDRDRHSIRGLSEWDVHALNRRNPLSADHGDLTSGYANIHEGASGSFQGVSTEHGHMVADEGFQRIAEAMANGARVLYDTRVVDVRRTQQHYVIQCRCREKDGFVNRIYQATSIFICVPPHCAERWTILSQWARAQLYAVKSLPLHHIYTRTDLPTPFHLKSPTTLLGQAIGAQYDNGWFQASYTSGRLARFWYNMRLSTPITFAQTLIDEIRRSLHIFIEPDTIESHFHEHAYHIWRPHYGFDLDKAVRSSVCPNPKHLPNVFWCGEAFSSLQGWFEGALETADLAVDVFVRKVDYVLPRRVPRPSEMVLEGRILDVGAWASVHPGGTKAIENHKGENVTDLFYHIRHSDNAWAIVHALQIGIVA